jgi:hypothetical protein
MTLSRCGECGQVYLAAPGVCGCGARDFRTTEASGHGRVYSCTTLHAAAEGFAKDLPFQIAIIELDEGARLTARITGPAITIGDAVELADERDGVCVFRAAAH